MAPTRLRGSRTRAVGGLSAALLVLAGCTLVGPDGEQSPAPTPTPTPTPEPLTAELRLPEAGTTVLDADEADTRALAMSQALFVTAPVAVVAAADDVAAQLTAASVAVALGAPMLLDGSAVPDGAAEPDGDEPDGGEPDGGEPDGTAAPDASPSASPTASTATAAPDLLERELDRLGVTAVVTVGEVELDTEADVVPAPEDVSTLVGGELTDTEADPEAPVGAVAGLDRDEPALLTAAPPGGGEADDGGAQDPGAEADDGAAAGADEGSEPGPAAGADDDARSGDEASGDRAEDADEEPSGDATPSEADVPSGSATPSAESGLPPLTLADALTDGLVLTTADAVDLAAVATARAAGVGVLVVPNPDPRTSPGTIEALAASEHTTTIALGPHFGTAEDLSWRVATASTGVELPGGGQVLFPGRRMVALYGTPGTAALGVLGEQGLPESIARAQDLAAQYQAHTTDTVVPAFEIIATIASAGAGDDGNYSNELPVESFVPWVEAARDAGVYVVLDLQPGRTDFLTQAKGYEQLLLYPNVGLALDPEWRLKPDQVHLRQIGSVPAAEVNQVVDYLATLTRENALPQKLLILHQFSLRMITERHTVDTSRPELAVMIHADGQGSQPAKQDTWNALRREAPPNTWWGWKNFHDEDVPMLTVEQTYTQVQPAPHFVSYQ